MPATINRHSTPPATTAVIALALEDTQCKGALISETGRVLATSDAPLKQTTVRATVAAMSDLILTLAALPERNKTNIKAVGISVAGIIDHRAERVSFTKHASFHWERVPLRTMIETVLDHSGLDIRVPPEASPARAAAMTGAHPLIVVNSARDTQVAAEAWCGAACGQTNVALLTLGNEIHAGFLLDGKVLHGAGDLAGAASWLTLHETYQSEYATRGAFAVEVSESALVRHTLEKWSPDTVSLLSQLALTNPAQITAATIVRAARSSDPLALSAVEETCHWVGRATANIISLLNPEAVIISGSFGQLLKPFLKEIRREAKRWAAPAAMKQCQIVSAKLGAQAELIGAAKLAWERVGTAS